MRVLFVTGAFPPMKCGVGDYTAHLVAHLAAFHDVVPGVLTSSAADGCLDPPQHFFPVIDHWSSGAFRKVMRAVKRFHPDIVHLQYPASFGRFFLPNFLPLIFSAKNIAMVQTWHEYPIYSQLINTLSASTLVVVDPRYPESYRWPYRSAVRHMESTCIPVGANIPRVEPTEEERNAIRRKFNAVDSRLIVFFGFAQPFKGIELLFESADPARDRLVLICDLVPSNPYHASILRLVDSPSWRGKSFVTGYLSASDSAAALASADAAVFPFTEGATSRNGSVLAARLQGIFVVTTHAERRGYDAAEHISYVAPGDITAIREALNARAGTRCEGTPRVMPWDEIAGKHRDLYEKLLRRGGKIEV